MKEWGRGAAESLVKIKNEIHVFMLHVKDASVLLDISPNNKIMANRI
jgi:hypothetical protein